MKKLMTFLLAFAAAGTLSGSALNTKLSECDRRNRVAYAEYYSLIEEMERVPQGNIVARGLRGKELEAKLAEIFK